MKGMSHCKIVEGDLRHSGHFFVSVLNSVKSLVVVLDRDGNLELVNKAFEELTGFSAKELLEQGIWDTVVPPEKATSIQRNFCLTLLGVVPEKDEIEVVTRSGERRLTSWSLTALTDDFQESKYIIATGTDITEARRLEQALQASEQRFRHLAENARDIIYRQRLIPEPCYEYMSPATFPVTGYEPEDFYADASLDLQRIWPEDRVRVQAVYQGQFKEQDAYRWQRKDGKTIWMEVLRTPVYDKQGRLVAIEGVSRDITKRKTLEEKLRYLSLHDAMTGLYNRAYFEEEMQRLDNTRDNPVGIIIIDMDGLKVINDTQGHATGDFLIKSAAQVIQSCFRKNDMVARIGGDEFAILLARTSPDIIVEAVQRIHEALKLHNKETTQPVNLSIGWAIRITEAKSMSELFREADRHMYGNKPYNREKSEQK